jgi:hypothetical protein
MNLKILLAAITIFIFSINTYCQEKLIEESDLAITKKIERFYTLNLQSEVTFRYEIEDGEMDSTSDLASQLILDRNNNRFTEINYYPSFTKTETTFDGKKITDVTMSYENGIQMSKVTTDYNPDGKIKEKKYYFGDSYTFRIHYDYNDNNNIDKLIYYDPEGTIINYSYFTYDKNGNILSELKYNHNDSLEMKYYYEYDKGGNCTKEINSISNVATEMVKEYKYDKENNLTEVGSNFIGSNNIHLIIKYKYDAAGNPSEETHFGVDGKIGSVNHCEYDNKGRIIECKFKDYIENIEYVYKTIYQSN